MAVARSALDIGCGDGGTLLASAGLFQSAAGVDESEYALQLARAEAQRRSITNLRFDHAKAVSLPYADDQFDFVFSERGPIGHSDVTMVEALRVLQAGGRIFYETGAWIDDKNTALTILDQERCRVERFGVQPEILASRIDGLEFRDVYTWFEYQCTVWRYLETEPPWPFSIEEIERKAAAAGGDNSPVRTPYHMIWVGGRKI
jgi:ubiquinone/menaquinone biosynthesis C-methylase UbiE